MPILIVNFKTYLEGTGRKALALAKAAEEIWKEMGVNVAVAPQFSDIFRVSSVGIPVLAQHVDPVMPGSNTGSVLPEAVKEAGAVGSLLNHSERKLSLDEIKSAIRRLRELGLDSVVCADDVSTSKAVARLNPDIIAIEPPELIGSGISVSKANPEIVRGTVRAVREVNLEIKVICGAGLTEKEDVAAAVELGTEGVLVASGIVLAKKPIEVLREFTSALKGGRNFG